MTSEVSDPTIKRVPRVFVSYSHDSLLHQTRVLELSNRLRTEGVDCHIDVYYEAPPEGWPRWMLNQVEDADYVLVVCTEAYERRFQGRELPGKGKGAKWEGAVITQQLYDAELYNTRFIPVLFDTSDEPHIPIVLRGTTFYDISTEDGYLRLYRRFTAQLEIAFPPVAETVREMPARDIVAEQRLAEATEKLERAKAEIDRNNFELAAELSEEAAKLARAADDKEVERKAVLRLVRTLGHQAISRDVEESERKELVERIHKYIDRLAELGERPAVVALEKALLARLEGNPEAALHEAEEAIAFGGDDLSVQADALIARLQALWQLGRPAEGLALSAEVEDVRSQAEDDPSLCLDATWLRTLCKAGRLERADVERFVENVRSIASRGIVSRERVALVLNEVESELGRADRIVDRLLLCELAYKIMEPLRDRPRLILVSIEAAELCALVGDAERARLHLGRADSWVGQEGRPSEPRDEESDITLEARRSRCSGWDAL
jgi:tetratricopeptide (TPR) repeat protein